MHKIEIKIESKNSKILYDAIRHEEAPRAKVYFKLEGNKLIIRIEGKRISNLRAAINSFMKWIDMIEKIDLD